MAAGRSYLGRGSYRFLPGERDSPTIVSDPLYELDESEVWNATRSASPELRRPVPSSRPAKRQSSKRGDSVAGAVSAAASSLPLNIPDWSKILKEDYGENRSRENEGSADSDEDYEDGGNRIPPHEFLARQLARTRIASFSLHEGIGRTLKGRDLSRVRNAIWEKTGFQD
ncbi:protein S40-4-like [Malania oleifera]|uniref:protein S40-4-like n=1 Tax=Malania oleifera TaxID=397392 RepID=UPI0025AE5464|nr:protein S40-4-like [Malania oleifera]